MQDDQAYKDVAAAHRGEFLENTIYNMLVEVFGKDHVFRNVTISKSKSEVAAEADVLVVHGEFILVIQAKSKRLTLAARSGDLNTLQKDFRLAIQKAYDQAIKTADLLVSGAECNVGPNNPRRFELLSRIFPVVVLSDHFPSITILADKLIVADQKRLPAIIDIFFLEAKLELLRSPVDVLYYLQQRTRFWTKLKTDNELNLLGYHLKQKLYVPEKYDSVLIHQDLARDIEDYLLAKEMGHDPPKKFATFEERIGVPEIAALLSNLKAGPPEVAGIAIELLDYSSDALKGIAKQIQAARSDVMQGKALKAFSVETAYGGLSYVAVNELSEKAKQSAELIGRKHKYARKKDRWYVVVDYVHSPNAIDAVLPIWERWQQSDEAEAEFKEVDRLFNSSFVDLKPEQSSEIDATPQSKAEG
jgi:hypothetical protein